MKQLDELLLLSKNDIPFSAARLSLHQPTIKEIAYIGEENFFTGIHFLNLSKSRLDLEEQEKLKDVSEFDIILEMAQSRNPSAQIDKNAALLVLTLIFPDYKILFLPTMIAFVKDSENFMVNQENFVEFRDILKQMFCLDELNGGKDKEYNPANAAAARIANQIYKHRKKIAELNKKSGQSLSILARYLSILAVGEQKDMNALLEYSVCQLFDEFNRFNLKQQSDLYISAKLAGATDLREVKDWTENVHTNLDNDDDNN